MKVSAIETWARSLGNLASSQAISHDDVDSSVNMTWKDLYARLVERDDDYWTQEQIFTPLTPYATANPYEYKIPLPSDFYKLRFVDFLSSQTGSWTEMHKFPLSMRNDPLAAPHYRFDAANLWVIGANLSQVRVHYYPPPALLSHPDVDLNYGTSYAPNLFPLISSPAYCLPKNTMVYVYNAQNIVEESIDSNSVTAPVTLLAVGANVSNLVYYKGYLYWIQAGDIKRAPTDLLTAPLVPGAVTANGTITSFSINYNKIYYTTTTDLRSCTLAGASDAQLAAYVGTSICADSLGGVYFTEATTNHLHKLFVLNPLETDALHVTIDINDTLYLLHTTFELHQFTTDSGFTTVLTHNVLRTDIAAIGQWAGASPSPGSSAPNQRIPCISREGQTLFAISSYPDTDITYPSNTILEILAVQAAIDWCTKLGKDIGALKLRVGDPDVLPTTGLWASFKRLIKRDEYEPERIKNSRSPNAGMGLM